MPSQKSSRIFQISQWVLFLVVLLLGLFFRLTNVETKVFWVDEVATTVRVSGHNIPDITADLLNKEETTARDLLAYQFSPSDLSTTWQALTTSPEHAPLFFILTRAWVNWVGHSVFTLRLLAIAFSFLVFPALYWLLQELFSSSLISAIGLMLMSVSPFYVAYAQEARPYSLWTTSILLMGASLLRAVRVKTKWAWVGYIFCLVLAVYTSLLSFFVAAALGIYILLASRRQRLIIHQYLISSAIALVLFSPWLYVVITGINTLENNTGWMRTSLDFSALVATWIGTVLLIFGDLPLSAEVNAVQMAIAISVILLILGLSLFLAKYWRNFSTQFPKVTYLLSISGCSLAGIILFSLRASIKIDLITLIGGVVAIFILGLAGYSLYHLTRNSSFQQKLFIWCLLLATPLPLIVADILSQGQSSGAPRYLIPTQLAIQIAAAYTLGSKLDKSYTQKLQKQTLMRLIVLGFISLGIFSCTRNLNLSPIYLKSRNVHNPAIAAIINQKTPTMVLLEPELVGDILSLSRLILPETEIKVINSNHNSYNLARCSDELNCYLLKPSQALKYKVASDSRFQVTSVYAPKLFTSKQIALDLWQISTQK